ncbi:MAG: excinuclease ABC subunit UvrA [Clostridia bacterium]|nr:excinuclease ABC subunit UvrA [Clostridia bacterium]
MPSKQIIIKGARVHNLKNIDVTLPRDRLVVLTGLSGSGKSSLAFDTLYAEGHRRFVESLSSYARMFLGQVDKPDVDQIEGLSPAIAIDQKTTSQNPRSTVGTVTEIYDYLRLLYARIGIPHCPVCGKEIRQQTQDQMVDAVMALPEGTRFMVLAPVVRGKKGMHEKVFDDARRSGFARVRVDGALYDLSEDFSLDKNSKHSIDVVVDRLVMRPDVRARLSESIGQALARADNRVCVAVIPREGEEAPPEMELSGSYACEEHRVSFGKLEPRMFSFNNPFGACPHCAGLGDLSTILPAKLIPDPSLTLRQGAVACNGFKTMDEEGWSGPLVAMALEPFGCTLDTPLRDFPPEAMQALMYGTGAKRYHVTRYFDRAAHEQTVAYEGVIPTIERRAKMFGEEYYRQFAEETPCPECHGRRLNPMVLSVTVGGLNIDELTRLSVERCEAFFAGLTLTPTESEIARDILKEIRARLSFLRHVGLEYLTLARKAGSLSGGEAQHIRLATQIGSALVGVMYILDEPSIGLHQRDNGKLISTLKDLRDLGNTVVVVEHDEETIRQADYVVDVGPGAGIHGGEIVACCTPDEVARCPRSITGDYLAGRRRIPVPAARRPGNGHVLRVVGAREHNLKDITVEFPLGCFVCVTGVSGSGKSSLVNGILRKTLLRDLNRAITYPGDCDRVEGQTYADKVIDIDQSPIGRTPRSNPATYTGLFTDIRDLFAKTPVARARGYTPGRFSFNVKGGRCEACEGDGVKCIEMHFLPDVYVRCDQCGGTRYNRDTLDCLYKGKNISDVLNMTVEEGLSFFDGLPAITRKLQTLFDVGLGYVQIGQSSTTLSGGEAQRVKLATELARRSTGKTVYILDEPTTGLHSEDVKALIAILQRLVDAGNTAIVIEHNLDLIKCADYLIDLGPEGGERGGRVIACGTPEQVARTEGSYTGLYLREKLAEAPAPPARGKKEADGAKKAPAAQKRSAPAGEGEKKAPAPHKQKETGAASAKNEKKPVPDTREKRAKNKKTDA